MTGPRQATPEPVSATVTAVLPNAMYRVRLERGEEIMAHVAGDLRVSFVRILAGDRVQVQVSPFDPTKGRIVARAGGAGAPHTTVQENPS